MTASWSTVCRSLCLEQAKDPLAQSAAHVATKRRSASLGDWDDGTPLFSRARAGWIIDDLDASRADAVRFHVWLVSVGDRFPQWMAWASAAREAMDD
jgi:hypothetical protein